MLLQDKVALITGAAAGIGEITARLFAREGAWLYILDVNHSLAERVASEIRSDGGAAWAFEVDVRRPEMVSVAVNAALREFGCIDVLVNNAGIYPRRTFLEMTVEDWDRMHDINLKGVFHCTKLVLPHMVARRSGKIVNISSVTFYLGTKNLTHYVASKGGVIGLTRSLAREVGEHNVHVNCVTPGAIKTEAEKNFVTEEAVKAMVDEQSLKRRIVPLDVARVCLFLSSELSDGMTGQTLNVDGGWMMH